MNARIHLALGVLAGTAALAMVALPTPKGLLVLPPPIAVADPAPVLPPLLSRAGSGMPVLRFVLPLDPGQTAAQPADASTLILTGIVGDGRRAVAVMTAPDGQPVTLARGDQIGGWTIERVTSATVRLRRGRETVEKELFVTPIVAGQRMTGAPREPGEDRGVNVAGLHAREPASAPPPEHSD